MFKVLFSTLSRMAVYTLATALGLAIPSAFASLNDQAALMPLNTLSPPEVVKSIDLAQYTGLWFEVASTRPVFQADCYCSTAQYTQTGPAEIAVVNSCRRGSPGGTFDSVTGTAKIPDINEPAKISVNFGGPELPFTNYWIVSLAPDYSYAVVSGALRSPIYILGRTPELPAETKLDIVLDLSRRGFDVGKLDFDVQTGCAE